MVVTGICIFSRPLVRRGLACVHRGDAKAGRFHRLISRITALVTFRVAHSVPLRRVAVRAPIDAVGSDMLTNGGLKVVPVLHTKVKVISNVLGLVPTTGINRVNLCHSPRALRPIRCCTGLPDSIRRESFVIISPVLTAKNSTVRTVRSLGGHKNGGVGFVYLVTTPRKMRTMRRTRPSISVCVTTLSRGLGRGNCVIPNLNSTNSHLFKAGWGFFSVAFFGVEFWRFYGWC